MCILQVLWNALQLCPSDVVPQVEDLILEPIISADNMRVGDIVDHVIEVR